MQGVKYTHDENELSKREVLKQCRILDGCDPITGERIKQDSENAKTLTDL